MGGLKAPAPLGLQSERRFKPRADGVMPWELGGPRDPEMQARGARVLEDQHRAAQEEYEAQEAARAAGQRHYTPPGGVGVVEWFTSAGHGDRRVPETPQPPADPLTLDQRRKLTQMQIAENNGTTQAPPAARVPATPPAAPDPLTPEQRAKFNAMERERILSTHGADAKPGPWIGGYDTGRDVTDEELEDIRARAAREELKQQRTIRRVTGPDGRETFTNVGQGGEVVIAPDDSGQPSRGTFSSGGGYGSEAHLSALRNLSLGEMDSPDDVYLEQARIALARKQMEDPLFLEREKAQIEADSYMNRATAGQRAEQSMRESVLRRKADIDLEYQQDLAEMQKRGYTPEQMAQAMEMLEQDRSQQYARAGIPNDAKFGVIG